MELKRFTEIKKNDKQIEDDLKVLGPNAPRQKGGEQRTLTLKQVYSLLPPALSGG